MDSKNDVKKDDELKKLEKEFNDEEEKRRKQHIQYLIKTFGSHHAHSYYDSNGTFHGYL